MYLCTDIKYTLILIYINISAQQTKMIKHLFASRVRQYAVYLYKVLINLAVPKSLSDVMFCNCKKSCRKNVTGLNWYSVFGNCLIENYDNLRSVSAEEEYIENRNEGGENKIIHVLLTNMTEATMTFILSLRPCFCSHIYIEHGIIVIKMNFIVF